jgi:hypothetical protein
MAFWGDAATTVARASAAIIVMAKRDPVRFMSDLRG